MRIVWKDSFYKESFKPIKYRKHFIQGTPDGWTTDIPGDDNLYANHYSAHNAIDKYLGGTGVRGAGTSKRRKYGIKIVGKKDRIS